MANSKIVFGDEVLIDLTGDTITAADLKAGVTAHGKDGEPITGTSTLDSDTSNDTAAVAEILSGKTAHARGAVLTGTMPNRGGVSGSISSKTETYSIQQGYHDGSGTVGISSTEQAKIVAGNIKSGVKILGITGTYTGAAIKAQSKNATPTRTQQTIQPDSGYDYLSNVVIAAIPYQEQDNSAGGKTVTIG